MIPADTSRLVKARMPSSIVLRICGGCWARQERGGERRGALNKAGATSRARAYVAALPPLLPQLAHGGLLLVENQLAEQRAHTLSSAMP